ncbi:MAG: PKD domain-containing protein, partial [Methanospirillum sp.]
WGSFGTGDGQFSSPFGVAVDPDGNVYVTDALNNRTQKFSSDGDYLAQWGGPGTGNGQFNIPTGIAVDAAGNVYVADYGNSRVQKFTSEGGYLTQWGGISGPYGIAVNADGSRVYVSEVQTTRVRIFDTAGTPLGSFGGPGTGDGQVDYPLFIAVDAAGSVYVADTGNDRVQKFTSAGDFVTKWGSRGSGDGQFDKPAGIAVDSSGFVYVADWVNNRVEKFASDAVPVEANFTANTTSGTAPLAVAFTDASTGDGITNRSWTFGDGETSTETNPFHTYTAAGNYTVNLTVTGASGTDSEEKAEYITVSPPARDKGYFLVSTVPAGAEINFRSSKGDLHYKGTTSAGPLNVTVLLPGQPQTQIVATLAGYRAAVWNITQYPAPGETVPVDLTLEPIAPPAPVANFTANATLGTAPLAVAFTDTSTGDGIANRTWTFGDGATSTERSPVHVYAAAGNYTVNLTVANAGGQDSEERQGYIRVMPDLPPVGGDRSYYLVSTVPAGAEIYFEGLGGTRYHQGNTSAGPLNVTLCRSCTPMRKVVATMPGYLEAAYAITAYPARGETVAVCLTRERGTDAPFPGPHVPSARIEAEDFDTGGEGVAYHDAEPANLGGAYRPAEGVDIETANGVTDVGWTRAGERLTYTVDTTIAGSFSLTLRAANPDPARKSVLVLLDGEPVTEVDVRSTGGWTSYAEFGGIEPLPLRAGRHTVTLAFEGTERINLDWLLLSAGQVPAGGGQPYPSVHAVPGRVEAEDYDTGGFADTTPANEGGAYRHDAVDIERGGSNYDVGWIRPGEYLQYSVDAAAAGTYTVSIRVANPGSAVPVSVRVNGGARVLTVPATGSFGAWQTATLADVPLAAGRNTVRVETGRAGSFNLDYLEFATGTPTPTVTATPTGAAGASFTASPLSASKGTAVKFTLSPAAGKTVKSAWWSFDAPAHLTTWNSRATNPTFFYPAAGSFSPYVKIVYTDNSVEEVRRAGYIRAT